MREQQDSGILDPSAIPAPGKPVPRLRFIDVARALAAIEMVVGHTLHATLLPVVYHSSGLAWWRAFRAHTAIAFMTAAGAALGYRLATSGAARRPRRIRRYGLVIGVGYALRFPLGLWTVPFERWPKALAGCFEVDVLQCIGVSLLIVELFAMLGRRRAFPWLALAAGVLVLGFAPLPAPVTPPEWSHFVSNYVSKRSPFPLFPWTGFLMFGAAVGWQFGHPGPAAKRAWWLALVVPFSLAFLGKALSWSADYRYFRLGVVWLGFAAIHAALWRGLHVPERAVGWISRRTLSLYAFHILLVYGSTWGLRAHFGHALELAPALALGVATFLASMGMTTGWEHARKALRSAVGVRRFLKRAVRSVSAPYP